MNWTRGLVRAWLLASIALTGAIGWFQWDRAEVRCYYGNFRYENDMQRWRPDAPEARRNCRIAYEEEFSDAAYQSLGASFAIFVVGAAIVWVVRGFQRVDQPKSPLA